ncbi:MAG: shikimate dehydrogenase [Candidatus Omnitrophota bacterium]
MKLFGLIGFPVKHSYSALMHNAAFAALGLDARYELFEIEPAGLEEKFRQKIKQGVRGFNVTIPHKEKILTLLDEIDEEAEFIGAVNTIKVNEDATTKGFNTDGLGFIYHLKTIVGFNPADKRVALLGAGGAARALVSQLARQNASEIALFDIDQEKTDALVNKIQGHFSQCWIHSVKEPNDLLGNAPELLINATPLGLHRNDRMILNPDLFHSKMLVYDLIYNPAQTSLLLAAKAQGCHGVFNGLGMLLYQGVLAFKIWLEFEPPVEVMEEALRDALVNNHNR